MLTSFVSPILVPLVSVCILRNRVFQLSICGSQGPTWDILCILALPYNLVLIIEDKREMESLMRL